MGCQTEIATQIVNQGGDYLLAVKANQGSLHEAIISAFGEARSHPLDGLIIEKNRGRIEARAYYVLPANQLKDNFPNWMNLNTLGMCLSYRHTKGKVAELSYRYYISSATLDEQQLADSVRGHWY